MSKKKPTKRTPIHSKVIRAAHTAVVPQAQNHYRPHLIRRQGLSLVIVIVFVLQISYNFFQTGSVLGQSTDITRQRLLAATNTQRAREGAIKLEQSQALNSAAQAKVNDMFQNQYWAHTSPGGVAPWQWIKQSGYAYDYAGENLAKGFHTSQGVITAWLDSPEHRENMLDDRFREVGFAVKNGSLNGVNTTLIVALYAAPSGGVTTGSGGSVLAAGDGSMGILSRLGVGIQSMTPALIGSITVMFGVVMVSLAAHAYRRKLPKALRQSWYRHHGLIKAAGMTSMIIVLIALYGGGQI